MPQYNTIDPSSIPRLTILESFKVENGKYSVYSSLEPLFYRSALRNCKLSKQAHNKVLEDGEDASILAEIEYSLLTIISATTCLESYINMIIDKYPTKPDYKKLSDLKKKWLLVTNFLNPQNKLDINIQPFLDFVRIVNLRNDSIHYFVDYKKPENEFAPIYNNYCYKN